MSDLHTAIVIVLDDARPQLEQVRAEFFPEGVSTGIPLHVTLLVPFVPADQVDEAALEDFFVRFDSFTLTLAGLAAWPRVVYAVPEPRERLLAMMHAVFERWPEYPPYEGEIEHPEPHATLTELEHGQSLADVFEQLRERTQPLFPLACEIRDVTLLEEYDPDRWRERRRFPLRA